MSKVGQAEHLLNMGPGTYDLEQSTKNAMALANQNLAQDSTQQLLTGVGQPGQGLVSAQKPYDFSVALGGDTGREAQNVTDALTRRNTARSQEYIDTLKRDLAMTAPVRDQKRLATMGQNLAAEAEVKLNNNRILKQYELDKKRVELYKQQRKDAVLGTVLGVIGAIGGAALAVATGGTSLAVMGAAAAAGSAAGKAAGGGGQ